MSRNFKHVLPSLAVFGLVATGMIATPSSFAAGTETVTDKAAAQKPIDRADARIRQLHDSLQITPDQEPKFDKLADVMRDNAKEMSAAVEKRSEAKKTTTALDDLKAYQAVAEAHADGLKQLVPAFETLYDALSDSQKKEADALFIHGPGHGQHGHKS
jgi:protein CpxP